jgi:Tfp pilus assembly protein PilV
MDALEAERNVCGGQEVYSRGMPRACGQGGGVCKERHPRRVDGITLVEVLVSLMLASMAALTIYSGISLAMRHSQHTAHRVAAFGRCRQLLEEMRGAPYAQVTAARFPDETVRLTHLGGMNRIPVEAVVASTITEAADPARKLVVVTAEWEYMGRAMTETVAGHVFDRDSRASSIGVVTGSLALNPSSERPAEFTLWLPDGSVIDLSDLESAGGMYSGPASRVHLQPGGSGIQTSLRQNFQPYPIANAGRWGLSTSGDMTVALSLDDSSGLWTLGIDGTGVIVTSY